MSTCKCGPYYHPSCDNAAHRHKAFREYYRAVNPVRPRVRELLKLSETRHSSWAFVTEDDYCDESEGD